MKLLTKEQEQGVVSAIAKAEKGTSAEVKVHIDKKCSKEPLDRAAELFFRLKMEKTELRNGVLIYIASDDRKMAILGDKGINELVEEGFWNETYSIMRDKFSHADYYAGLCGAIESIGEKLSHFFPYQSDDVNELSDEISYEGF